MNKLLSIAVLCSAAAAGLAAGWLAVMPAHDLSADERLPAPVRTTNYTAIIFHPFPSPAGLSIPESTRVFDDPGEMNFRRSMAADTFTTLAAPPPSGPANHAERDTLSLQTEEDFISETWQRWGWLAGELSAAEPAVKGIHDINHFDREIRRMFIPQDDLLDHDPWSRLFRMPDRLTPETDDRLNQPVEPDRFLFE